MPDTHADIRPIAAEPPEPGTLREVAPGVLWLRLALPFALNHVNVYLIEDGAGWAVLDTGIDDARTRGVWETLLDGPLRGRTPTRIIVTHYHPDHVGLAGWLSERCGAGIEMSRTDYLLSQVLHSPSTEARQTQLRRFNHERGLDEETSATLLGKGSAYLKMTSGLPPAFRRLRAGQSIGVGGRTFGVLTGGGHAPEQVMLHDAAAGLFFSADQVIARISPNISVWPWEPEADPLGEFLDSLDEIEATVPADTLVLAGHHMPFHGLHDRVRALRQHHAERCQMIEQACRDTSLTEGELIAVLFPRALDPQQAGFAFGEVVAHANYLVSRGRLTAGLDGGVRRLRA